MTKKYLMKLAAVLCCAMTMAVFTACTSDNDDNPANPTPGVDSKIVVIVTCTCGEHRHCHCAANCGC